MTTAKFKLKFGNFAVLHFDVVTLWHVAYHSCVSESYSPYSWSIVIAFGFNAYVITVVNGLPFGCNWPFKYAHVCFRTL